MQRFRSKVVVLFVSVLKALHVGVLRRGGLSILLFPSGTISPPFSPVKIKAVTSS